MKNTLGDLNNYLFEQMERLNDEEMTEEEFQKEIKRSEAITKIGSQIIQNGHLALKAAQFKDNKFDADANVPKMSEG